MEHQPSDQDTQTAVDQRRIPDGRWSKLFDRCQGCRKKSTPHAAKGLCHDCYQRAAKAKWYQRRKARDPNFRKAAKSPAGAPPSQVELEGPPSAEGLTPTGQGSNSGAAPEA